MLLLFIYTLYNKTKKKSIGILKFFVYDNMLSYIGDKM